MLQKDYQLEDYRIIDVLGVGGFGVTYVAEDESLQERVAIKEFLPAGVAHHVENTVRPITARHSDDYQRLLESFLSESRNLARIRHHHVVRVRRCFKRNGTAYMVMDYEDGEDLQVYIKRLGRALSEVELVAITGRLLDGLQAVHGVGLVHRDLKPSNIFIRRADGSPVLLDFGAARQTDASHFTAILTTGYAPIEQYEEEAAAQGPWTDIYSTAAVLYWVITGAKPLAALNRMALDRLVPAVEAGRGRWSEGFLAGVDRGLALLPEDRPRTVGDWRRGWLEEGQTAPVTAPVALPVAVPPSVEPPPPDPAPPPEPMPAVAAEEPRDITVRLPNPQDFAVAPLATADDEDEVMTPEEEALWPKPPRLADPARPAAAAQIARPPDSPAPDEDDGPRRFDFIRPKLGTLALVGFLAVLELILANVVLAGVFHGFGLSGLGLGMVVTFAMSTVFLMWSREVNLYSAAVISGVMTLGAAFLFLLLFRKVMR